ncbi:hypothetical protein CSHISOI_08000 [Colletotrichum shisoi]|uniref:Uncharacterized protein n=1 Tax=Colletotrichum shisoi TaxID=2078593 RepID=A0A5Q4BLI2_9PEZI|nr:hypothetical protein CSHISOI_08000 [Colletotrichum shisoi]
MGVWRSKTKHHLALGGELVIRDGRGVLGRKGDLLSGRGGPLRASSPSSGRSQTSPLTQNRPCAVVLYRCFYNLLYNGGPPSHPDGVVHLPISSH